MNELDRDIALCTCLEVEEIRGKAKLFYFHSIHFKNDESKVYGDSLLKYINIKSKIILN